MIAALLLAACQPLATCGNPVVPPCASPTPTLAWDRVADTPGSNVAGYRLYSRPVGGSWTIAAYLPCWIEDSGAKRCTGPDIEYPVQRVTGVQLDTVEWAVKAINTSGVESASYSNVVPVCMPTIWTGGPYQ